jgi:hypothetical protein
MQITDNKTVLSTIEKLVRSDVCLEILLSEEYRSALIDNINALDRLMRTFTQEQKNLFLEYEHTSSQKHSVEGKYFFVKTIQYGIMINKPYPHLDRLGSRNY